MSDDPTRRTEAPEDSPMIPPPPAESSPESDQPGTDVPAAEPSLPTSPPEPKKGDPTEDWQPGAVEEGMQGEVAGHRDVQPATLDPDQKSLVLEEPAIIGPQAEEEVGQGAAGEEAAGEQDEEDSELDSDLEDSDLEDSDIDSDLEDSDLEEDAADPAAPRGPVELNLPEAEEIDLQWFILKVQSNRERSIADALKRKIAIEGLEEYFGEILVPTEKVTEFKGGKKKIVERKLWPGYIVVQMHVNDETWFAIRETSGIGDFTGAAGKPTPMQASEIALILQNEEEVTTDAPKLDIKFSPGDKVKVKEGNFENFEGEVSAIDEAHGRVTVMLSIFGRPTPVELEYWQVEGI